MHDTDDRPHDPPKSFSLRSASRTASVLVTTQNQLKRLKPSRLRAADLEARKAELVRVQWQRLFDELRTTLVRDIDLFRKEFPGDSRREIIFEAVQGG